MFDRQTQERDVRCVIETGEVIVDYSDDIPYPSCLVLGYSNNQPLHVVVAVNGAEQECYVITVYRPDPTQWSDDYRTRRTS